MKIFMEEKSNNQIDLDTVSPALITQALLKNVSGGFNNSGCLIGFYNNEKPTFIKHLLDDRAWLIHHCDLESEHVII